ncbi:hypothetical protein OAT29_00005, partial [Flavobacteriaceae bacterium]|nr:hypothetical protein [Flavobacteriaceae bacterium]
MKKLFLLLLFVPIVSFGQTTQLKTNLPFSEISEYPTEFSQANIVSRMIEGLGYRYYWATKSLTEKDLNYKPSDDTRSTLQILEHIYSLTEMISSSFKKNEFEFTLVKGNYNDLREKTLLNLKYIQDELKLNP